MYSEKMSRGEFLRRLLSMGGVTLGALVLAACGGEGDEEEEDDD